MKLRPEVKEKWLTALRSGDYEQTTGKLARVNDDGNTRYCCLGVLCELATEAGVVSTVRTPSLLTGNVKTYDGAGMVLPYSVFEWAVDGEPDAWEVDAGNFRVAVEFPQYSSRGSGWLLSELNDGVEDVPSHTFAQIADLIEENL